MTSDLESGVDGGAAAGTLVEIRAADAAGSACSPALYCLPPASGSVFAYVGLARLLRPEQPVYGFEAPGFDDDQEPADSLADLAAGYLAALRSLPRRGPYTLLGWSMGGTVAFDMACRLRAEGTDVGALILIDVAVPGSLPMLPEAEVLRLFLLDTMGEEAPESPDLDVILGGPAANRPVEQIFTEMMRAGWLPDDLDADFLASRYAVFRASTAAQYTYRPAARYEGPLTLIKAADTPAKYHRDWDRLAADIDVHTVPGDHYGIWRGAGLRALGDIVQRHLDRRAP